MHRQRQVEKINDFINTSKEDLIDPFKFSGVSDAVQRITRAKEENQVVVIYGDYDADGICAVSVLYKALKNSKLNIVKAQGHCSPEIYLEIYNTFN